MYSGSQYDWNIEIVRSVCRQFMLAISMQQATPRAQGIRPNSDVMSSLFGGDPASHVTARPGLLSHDKHKSTIYSNSICK